MSASINDYIIEGGSDGKSRLNILAEVLHSYTKALLHQQGIADGMSVLDAGCGGGHVALLLANLVGDGGHVTAIDLDVEMIALAERDAKTARVSNISFKAINTYDINYDDEFDAAYARFLLSHLKKPMDALLKMKQGIKTGGKIIVEDVQFIGHFCYPRCDAFDRYVNYYTQAANYKGADPEIGPKLVALFKEVGLINIGFDTIQPCFYSGQGKWMACVTLKNIKAALLEHHIVTPHEFDETLRELEEFTASSHTLISLPRIFRVWGTKN
jgi:ubiquinone/menaquinone biosynthesis C-methylase UbiE